MTNLIFRRNSLRQWGSMRDNRKRDFSLIELLVVIAIIAILAGLMLPALNSARLSALAVSCKNNQRQVGLGFSSYVNDFNGYLATSRYASGLSWTQTWPEFLGDNPIFTYVEDGGIYSALKYYNYKTNHCPAQRVRGWARPANAVGNSTWYNRMGFAAPRGDHEHYGWKADWRSSITTPAFHALNLNRVDKPAYAWGLTDNTNNNAEPAYFIQPSKTGPAFVLRHGNSCNMWFFDGHSESAKRERLKDLYSFGSGLNYVWVFEREGVPEARKIQ